MGRQFKSSIVIVHLAVSIGFHKEGSLTAGIGIVELTIRQHDQRSWMSGSTVRSPKPSVYLPDNEEVKKVFNHFDANGDSKISAMELVSVMKAFQSNTSKDEVKRIMEELDIDLDDFISLKEFASFCKGSDDTAGVARDDGGERP
ncbi:hypothetical protein ACSBR1_013691 [Camellia fascicularis]